MDGLRHLDLVVTIDRQPRPVASAIRTLAARSRSFDVVHAHGLTAGWVASLVRRHPPLVVTVHNLVLDEVEGRQAALLRRLEAALPARADATIAISAEVARRFTGVRGANRVTVVPPVAPTPAPQRSPGEVRAELAVPTGEPLVVLVGRLHPQKDVASLLTAVDVLRRQGRMFAVAIAGDGPQRRELERLTSRLGVGDIVRFLGERPDVADLMAAGDVVVMCSIWESYGLVVSEAMQLGRPVVATDVGPVGTLVIDRRTGRLVPASDPGALAEAIGDLLDEPVEAERLGANAAAHIAAMLAPDALIDRVVDVYRNAVKAR